MFRKSISVVFITFLIFSAITFASSSITIQKAGMSVDRWLSTDGGYDYLPNGAIRIGNNDLVGFSEPVYRFNIPALGTISSFELKIFATEHGSGETGVHIANYPQEGYESGRISKIYTAPTNEINGWIQGEGDSDIYNDFFEIMFVNSGYDDLTINSIEVTIEYANIDDAELIGKYQLLCNLHSILNSYQANMGTPIQTIENGTNQTMIEDGIQKSIAIADSLRKLDGFDISASSGWISNAIELKDGYNSTVGLWQSVVALVTTFPGLIGYPEYVGLLDAKGKDVYKYLNDDGFAIDKIETLLGKWRSAVIDDGSIDSAEGSDIRQYISNQVLGDTNSLLSLKIKINEYVDWVLSHKDDSGLSEYCETHIQLLNPLIVYNGSWNEDSYLIEEYQNLIQAIGDDFITLTFNANPSGENLHIIADGVTYTAPKTITWLSGKPLQIEAPSTQTGNNSKTYSYISWSDGGSRIHTITPTSNASYTATFGAVPDAPSNLSHSAIATNSITWTWQDNSNNEDGFRGRNNSSTLKWSASANTTSKTESGLSPNTLYTRHCHAYNTYGDSGASNSHSVYTAANKPGSGSFSDETTHSINVNWTANGNPAGTEYYCENTTQGTNSGWITGTSWVSTGLSSATTYSFRVKARNGDGIATSTTDLGSMMTQYDPILNSITPDSGPISSFLKIDGQYFYDYNCCVQFTGGTIGQVSEWTDTIIYSRVPSGTVSGNVTVFTSSQSNAQSFTVTDPTVIYVDPSNTSRMENGTAEYPFSTAQRGIDAATSGDEIFIIAGTYIEDISAGPDITINFLGSSTIDGQVTTGLGSNIVSDDSLVITGTSELGGDVNTVTGLIFQSSVNADGVDQIFDAGTGILHASTITKTTAGDLTLKGDASVELDGNVDVQSGSLTIEDILQAAGDILVNSNITFNATVTLDGSSNQSIEARGGKLWAKDTITKTTAGLLYLFGSTQVDLDGDVNAVDLLLNGDTVVANGKILNADTDVGFAVNVANPMGDLNGEGVLTIEAGDNIALGRPVESAGKLTLIADKDLDSIGSLTAMDKLTTTVGDLDIFASDSTIYLYNDVNSADDLLLNNNVEVYSGNTLFAGNNVIIADGKTLTGLGSLTIEAGDNIYLGGETETASTFILTANSNDNGLGDVEIKDSVTLTSGSFMSSGVNFHDPNSPVVTAGGNITINHTGLVTLDADLNPNGGTVSGTATQVIITPTGKIQDGIDVTSPTEIGDVMVKPGTYTGVGNRDINFKGKVLTLRSENGPETCIIDCQQQGRGFNFNSGEDIRSVLDGFTVTAGFCGISCSSSPFIVNCILRNNGKLDGYDEGGVRSSGNATITNCLFINNHGNGGGAITSNGGDLTITNCIFTANFHYSNYLYSGGGAIYATCGTTTVTNSIFDGNYCSNQDGKGGAILIRQGSVFTVNCTFSGNYSEGSGGAIGCDNGKAVVTNCIFWNNICANFGKAIYAASTSVGYSSGNISFCNVQGGQSSIHVHSGSTFNWGTGNIDIDPLFVNEGYRDFGDWIDGDYHRLPDSPCIDTGDPSYITDANDIDLAGNRRVSGGRVDMGAYEYQPEKHFDWNNDGIVNFVDFSIFAYYWADYECVWPYWCESTDSDESGLVDYDDLMAFSEKWLVEYPVVLYSEPLDIDPRWDSTGEWSFGQLTGDGGTQYGNPDPTTGYTGNNVYGVNLRGDYSEFASEPYYLTAGPFNCNDFSNIKLKFARWLNTDDPAYVTATIETSNDGVNWTTIWKNGRGTITDSSWRIKEYDISNVADDQQTVYIRWGYEVLDNAYPYSGWNIDDIQFWGVPK